MLNIEVMNTDKKGIEWHWNEGEHWFWSWRYTFVFER